MSSGARTVDPDRIGDDHADADWLERNARPLRMKQRQGTDAWDRAKEGRREADVEPVEHGAEDLFEVELPDGDRHLALLVRGEDQGFVGACSCEGYNYNGYCAHLLVLGQLDVTDGIVRRQDMRAAALAKDRKPAGADDDVEQREVVDVDEPDQKDSDEVLDEDRQGSGADHADPPTPSDTTPASASEGVQPQESTPSKPVASGESTSIMTQTPTQGPVDVAPQWAKDNIEERGGEMDLNKHGCQFVRAQLGIDSSREFLTRAEDTDFEYAVVECTAEWRGQTVTREAMAHIDESNVDKVNMNRMAETRAFKRAVKSISGGGLMVFATLNR